VYGKRPKNITLFGRRFPTVGPEGRMPGRSSSEEGKDTVVLFPGNLHPGLAVQFLQCFHDTDLLYANICPV
jgi:hypothetical protein